MLKGFNHFSSLCNSISISKQLPVTNRTSTVQKCNSVSQQAVSSYNRTSSMQVALKTHVSLVFEYFFAHICLNVLNFCVICSSTCNFFASIVLSQSYWSLIPVAIMLNPIEIAKLRRKSNDYNHFLFEYLNDIMFVCLCLSNPTAEKGPIPNTRGKNSHRNSVFGGSV